MPQLAFLMESVGMGEWVVLLAVILIVMGPKSLPETARKLGRWSETFRRAADEFKRQIMSMDQEVHPQEPEPRYSDYDYGSGEYHAKSPEVTENKDATSEPVAAPEALQEELVAGMEGEKKT